jgi:hypothetical protein
MEPEGSLPSSQQLSTCTYTEPDPIQSTTLNPISKRSIVMLSIHLRLGLPSGLFPSGFPTNNQYTFLFSPIRAICNKSILKEFFLNSQTTVICPLRFQPTKAKVKFEVFTAVTTKNGVFWDITPCGSCRNRLFGETWRLLHQGDKNRWNRNNTSCN